MVVVKIKTRAKLKCNFITIINIILYKYYDGLWVKLLSSVHLNSKFYHHCKEYLCDVKKKIQNKRRD